MGGNHLTSCLVSVVVWAIIILALPIATWLSTQDYEAAKTSFNVVFNLLLSPFLIYFVNFYVFGPLLFFMDKKEARAFRIYNKLSNRTRYWLFALCNLIAIPLFNNQFFMLWFRRDSIPNMPKMSSEMWIGFFGGMFMFLLLNCIVAGIAIAIRHFIRNRDIKQKAEELIDKYTADQDNVRNNREYDYLTKEIEYQTLNIELAEKRMNEAARRIEALQTEIEKAKDMFTDREHALEEKKSELNEIVSENKAKEETLREKAKKQENKIEERLLTAFKRIRKNTRNGLGIVVVQRNACGGCFNRIPAQRQMEIKMHKKVIVCEYCGRILIDPELVGITPEDAKNK